MVINSTLRFLKYNDSFNFTGMVKVWLLEKIPGEKDADSSEPK